MQIVYRHGFNNNLMIIRDSNIVINDYRINMIMRNKISGLLEMYIGCVNGESELSYIISSRQSVRDLFPRNKIKYEDVKILIEGIISLGKELREYLLDINSILLDLDFIYFDVDTKKVYFCYYPNNENSFENSFRKMLQDIVVLVEHNDYKAVELTYGIMEMCSKMNFSLYQIEQYISVTLERVKYTVPDTEPDINAYENQDDTYSDYGISNINDIEGEKDKYKNEKFNYLNEQINTRDEIKSIVGEEANYSIDNKHSDNNSLFGKFTKFLNTRNFKDTKVIKKEICVRENEPVCDEEPVMKYEDENVSEGETVLISDIIKDKKRKLFSLCDYDDIVINEYPFTIGKTSGKVDEIIKDKSVSRIHVRIDNEAGSFTIEDLNSRNGTFVNGERLNPYDKIEISIGDKITIASLDYIFK